MMYAHHDADDTFLFSFVLINAFSFQADLQYSVGVLGWNNEYTHTLSERWEY